MRKYKCKQNAKRWQILGDNRPNFDRNLVKCDQCWQMWTKRCQSFGETIFNFCENPDFGVMRKCANLVGLKARCKMNVYLQEDASIQPRTSPPKKKRISYHPPDFGIGIAY